MKDIPDVSLNEAPSRVQLPPGQWATVADFLCERFPGISRTRWLDRFERGRVQDGHGRTMAVSAPYRVGMTVHYFREVLDETRVPFEATILHADDDLVVADKPHFLAVQPAGRFVDETLLRRLGVELGHRDLVPLHRIDRATAGLVLFSVRPASRNAYQSLFRDRRIEKRYEALAAPLPELEFPLIRRSCIVRSEPFFRMQESAGPPNSETFVDVTEKLPHCWRYELSPVTGRKHQLRVHMAALGAPIINDPVYPELSPEVADDFDRPLKLLARSLAFIDPISGSERHFESRLTL
ncbi:pseudouridine synthase [Dokdonella sp.]|uniref:pseudouridine synthase n=1 Tax=Dokdonella sp. TaxID=2291710 RepID=UPI0035272238